MLKLTHGANKANAILIRIVLFLIGGIAIITGMCLFSGDMWMLTRALSSISPPPAIWWMSSSMSRVNLSSPCSTCLLLPRSGCWRYVKSPAADTASYITADGTDCRRDIYFPPPGGHPGRDASIQYGKHNISYTAIFWSKTNSDRHVTQPSKYEIFVEAKDPRWLIDRNNLGRASRCEVKRHTQFYTLSFNEGWFPDGDPQVMARQCTQVSDLNALSETAIMIARPIATVPVEAP